MAEQHRGYDQSVWSWSDDAPQRWRREWSQQLGHRGTVALLAETEGRPVGFVSGCITTIPDVFEGGKSGEIWDVFVRADCRGQGIGRSLVEAVEEHFKQAGAREIKFHVALHNAGAIKFYQALGYQPVMYRMHKKLPT